MNKHLLSYEMKKKGLSVGDLCERIHMSKSAFYRKIAGKRQFTLDEIKNIVSVLELPSPMEIFFAD